MVGVDLFSGARGVALGAKKAGINVKLAIEADTYAAALRVVTAYSTIEDIDVERELRRVRRAGESSPLTDMIKSAVRIASNFLVPGSLDSGVWKHLLPEERFYIKGVEIEAHGEYRDGVYQEFARGFSAVVPPTRPA